MTGMGMHVALDIVNSGGHWHGKSGTCLDATRMFDGLRLQGAMAMAAGSFDSTSLEYDPEYISHQ